MGKTFLVCLCAVFFFAAFSLAIVAFGDDSRYSFSNIQEEYGDGPCPQDPTDREPGGIDIKTCPFDKPISLMDAIGLSLNNNPDAQMAMFRIAQSKALIHKSHAAFSL